MKLENSTEISEEMDNDKSVSKNEEIITIEEQEIIDEFKKLGPEERESVMMQMEVSMSQYRGPIPSPDLLRQFEEICPGAADRLIKMAENQSMHRQEIEKKHIYSNASDSRLGLIFAFIITLISISGGLALIFVDKGAQGLTLICGIIVTLVGVFVYGTNSERKERVEKNKQLQKKSKKHEGDE